MPRTSTIRTLHLASREGQPEIARVFIDRGADVNAQDVYRSTPLQLELEVARLLIALLATARM